MVEQASPRLHFYEEIHVAFLICLTAHNRAEDTDVPCAGPCSDSEDFVTSSFKYPVNFFHPTHSGACFKRLKDTGFSLK